MRVFVVMGDIQTPIGSEPCPSFWKPELTAAISQLDARLLLEERSRTKQTRGMLRLLCSLLRPWKSQGAWRTRAYGV